MWDWYQWQSRSNNTYNGSVWNQWMKTHFKTSVSCLWAYFNPKVILTNNQTKTNYVAQNLFNQKVNKKQNADKSWQFWCYKVQTFLSTHQNIINIHKKRLWFSIDNFFRKV